MMGYLGFLCMWFTCFFVSFVTLLTDDTTGPVRDFTAVSQLVCCANLVSMGWGMTNGVKPTQASMLTINLDLFVTWLAFAYYGGGDVLSSSPIGVWNYIQVCLFSVFSLQSMVGLFAIAVDPAGYQKYITGDDAEAETEMTEA